MSGGPAIRLLRTQGVLTNIDRALSLAIEAPGRVMLPSFAGGGLVAMVVLTIYYLERVEGIRSLRLPLAVLLVLAWCGRALLLGRAARSVTERLWDAAPVAGSGRAVDVMRTAMVVAMGLWIWSWLLVLGSLGGPIGVALVLPILALRGAAAPSWIARGACEPEAGFRGFFRAAADNDGRRTASVGTECLLLFGTMGLALNLYLFTAVVFLVLRSFAGLEIASIETFLSLDNTFVFICVVAIAFVLMEPARAGLSAIGYVDARMRADGLDLRAAIDRAIEHAGSRKGALQRGLERAAIVLLVIAGTATAAHAQDLLGDPGEMPVVEIAPQDRETEGRVDDILAQPEFREFEDQRGAGLRRLFERVFEWLIEWLEGRDDDAPMESPGALGFGLPGAWFFLGAALLLLVGVGVYLLVSITLRQKRDEAAASATEGLSADPRERPPASFLDEAARLAEAGDLREALRALYLATLVALDRRRMIAFDPHLTNWQYLRQIPRGTLRDAFGQFTRLFDYKWYGREQTTHADYERCRGLARDIVGETEAAA